ncbi:MAG: LicD family protein [Alistipes sp.]|nr:LicD family protein [Alistipes sp.]
MYEELNIPEEFLREEVRCDYTVTAKMKRVWAVELGMLHRFGQVCERYGLRWYAMGGTLLGAVRHKGFIPWDDDIDLLMPREDYNRLLEIGPKEFGEPYFLQSPLTEHAFFRTHVQIRDSRTTGAILQDRHRDINRGIFMDIFPLDEVPATAQELKRHRSRLRKLARKAYRLTFRREYRSWFKRAIYALWKWLHFGIFSPAEAFCEFNRIAAEFAGRGGDRVGHTSLSYRDAVIWSREDWAEVEMLDFEMLKLPAPKGWDSVLRHHYGDYMRIPENKNGTSHGGVEFDPDRPYTEYFKNNNR